MPPAASPLSSSSTRLFRSHTSSAAALLAQDYLNTFTLSGNDSYFSHETMLLHNYHFTKHAPHFHDHFEIMLVLEGTVLQRIEDKDYLYNTGSCCLINHSLCHIETFNSSSKILFIGLSVELIEELFHSVSRLTLIKNGKSPTANCIILSYRTSNRPAENLIWTLSRHGITSQTVRICTI